MTQHQLVEQITITEAQAAAAKKSGRFLMQFISPGKGSSGYYSAEVLEAAATDRVIPKGTHMYADHPHLDGSGVDEHGNRSIKDLMAVVNEDAYVATDGALVGEVAVVPAWQPLLETVHESIGCSIRGGANVTEGEVDGEPCTIVESLVAPIMSVDFVTRPGRGGKVLQVLESAAANRRAIDHGIAESTVNDTREALQTALRDAHAAAKDVWLYVRDFDDATVWFEIDGSGAGDTAGIYGQAYTEADGVVTLSGTRTEVRVQTKYVPVTRPDSTTTATESEEDTMPKIQIEESEHTRLTETAGRVDAVESENTALKTENATLKEQIASSDRTTAARKIVEAADVDFDDLQTDGLLASLPVKESGEFDADAFTTRVTEAAAKVKARGGAGNVSGFGGTGGGGQADITESDIESAVGSAFGRPTLVKEA